MLQSETTSTSKKNISQKGPKVFVGLSGGVDSSVSALLLKEKGYDVTGVFIKVWQPDWITCTWKEDRLDAMRICAGLDIPFVTIDLEKEYKREVVDYMINEYRAGRTPNPDVMCNKYVKFGAFFNWAMSQGADYVATGHYAQVTQNTDGKVNLLKGSDANKDQSYFLWTLTQTQLSKTLFPVGDMKKPEVREIATKHNLITATKKDSQGLCFIGKINMKDFLKEFITPVKGNVLNEQGEVIGVHDGALFLTLGERHGFTITKKGSNDAPYYVVRKNMHDNTVTVSNKGKESNENVSSHIIRIEHCNWVDQIPQKGIKYMCRTRYRQTRIPCTLEEYDGTHARFILSTTDETSTPGQSLVLYDGEVCLGGGIIE